MKKRIETNIYQSLKDYLEEFKGLGSGTGFSFVELISAIKESKWRDRFVFDSKDEPDLLAKDIKYKTRGDRYTFPSYYFSCPFRINNYAPSVKSNGYKTKICGIRGYELTYLYFKTIPQLLATFDKLFPQIDEWEAELELEEARDLRIKRVQDLMANSSDDVLKEVFKDSGLQYYSVIGKDFMEVRIKRPRDQVYVFNISFTKTEKELPELVKYIKQLSTIVKQFDGVWIRNTLEWERNWIEST